MSLENLKVKQINVFISKLFTAVIQTHIFHLQITGKSSYAIHMALNEVYTTLPNIIDKIVETYQGKYEIIYEYKLDNITNLNANNVNNKNFILDYLKTLHAYIDSNRIDMFKDSDLLNIIDESKALLKNTIYKIQNLE